MRIKVLVEKQSLSLANTSVDDTSAKSSFSCGSLREIENDGDVRSKSAELEQATTGKACQLCGY